jgi:hypothetical protein
MGWVPALRRYRGPSRAVGIAGLFGGGGSGVNALLKAGTSSLVPALFGDKSGALELFGALAADRSIPGMPDPKTLLGEGSREQQMQNFKTAVLDRVKSAVELVARKGSPDETAAYRKMLADVAERAANASKEGGFLGFGGVRVSDKESAFISEVKRAAGIA